MQIKLLKKLMTLIATLAIATTYLTGCGGDGAPKVVAKDIDVAALMDQLMSDSVEDRLNALIELGDGRENAAPAIDLVGEVLTEDKDPKVREMAAYVLMMMGENAGKPALPTLKEAFENEKHPTVKINIINAWSAIDPDSAPGNTAPRQP
jgi:HEAT repeat protein